jgi:flavin-dependent dehydrogenase
LKVAIVGAGIAGAYLYARLRDVGGHEVTLYERVPRERYRAVCAWGAALGPMKGFAAKVGLNFADYILHEGRRMHVKLDGRELSIRLRGLVTFDKTRFVLDMVREARPIVADVTRDAFPLHKYDLVIDATGFHRRLLPKVKGELWVPTLQYVVKYRNPPHDDFYVQPFPGITGYGWYFPLGGREGHLGAGDIRRRHLQWLHDEVKKNGGEIMATVGRPVRINPSTRVDPIYDGKVVAVGEASGAIFPLVGEGIIPSLQSVDMLLEHWGDWRGYEEALRRKFEVYDRAYQIIESKVRGTFTWRGQLGNIVALCRHLARNVERYGTVVGLRDILPLLKI